MSVDVWDDPNLVLGEMNHFLKYLAGVTRKMGIKFTDLIEDLEKFVEVFKTFIRSNLPFINVIMYEIKQHFREHINQIKINSNNYTELKPKFGIRNMSNSLEFSFARSAFVSCPCAEFNGGINPFKELPSELKIYIAIGEHLKNDPMADTFVSELKKLKNRKVEGEKSEPLPGISYYASIVGPSLMGKTQTAFTLSHKMNVIYVNLLSAVIDDDAGPSQPIYSPFKCFSSLLLVTINYDYSEYDKALVNFPTDLESFSPGFYTLGILYLLICNNILKPCRSIEDRFLEMINTQSAMIPALKVSDFKELIKKLNVNLDEYLIFIDEIPSGSFDPHEIVLMIQFLRNLCRSVQLPTILCSTNSKVNYLIGTPNYSLSGNDVIVKKWVKVFAKTIKASAISVCCVLTYKPYQGINNNSPDKVTMSDFIDSSTGRLKELEFLESIFGPSPLNVPHLEKALKCLNLVLKNVKTTLPGIASLSVEFILRSLIKARDGQLSLENIWTDLNAQISEVCLTRKGNKLLSKSSLTSSAHILALPGILKEANEIDQFAALKVDEHYFYYGKRLQTCFDLCLENFFDLYDDNLETEYALFKDSVSFKDECHFAYAHEDFLLCYFAWNLWYFESPEFRFTLASLFQDYLKNGIKYANSSDKSVSDVISFATLSLWSIAYASHVDKLGNASGSSVLTEFIGHLHQFDETNEDAVEKKFEKVSVPVSLETFLNRITVPYLIVGPSPPADIKLDKVSKKRPNEESIATAVTDEPDPQTLANDQLKMDLAPFLKLGTCSYPLNQEEWDVLFDICFDGHVDTALIECKLWNTIITLSDIYPIYEKACIRKSKLSIIVSRKIQVFLTKVIDVTSATNDTGADDTLNSKDASSSDDKGDEKKIESNQEISNAQIEKLWKSGGNRINIYTISFDKSNLVETSNIQVGKFSILPLKEHRDPTGVFLMVESNFDPKSL